MNLKVLIIFCLIFMFFDLKKETEGTCADISEGSFDLFEEGKNIGSIYRIGKYQIEKYNNQQDYRIVEIKQQNCLFYMKKHRREQALDTITWSVVYTKHDKGIYSFIATPTYLKVNYLYEGVIKKTSIKVDKKVLKIYEKLDID